MIRALVALAAFLPLLPSIMAAAFAAGPIDLDVQANLEAIQRDRPEHYTKIERILAEAPRRAMDTKGVAQWLQTDFAAKDVRSTDLLRTSLPPKKRLEFALDGTSYSKTITLQSNPTATPVGPDGMTDEGRGRVQAYIRAARAGDCKSAMKLGEMYDKGQGGVSPDRVESLKWYNAARTLGCEVPMYPGQRR